jgi:hypothetical protein
MNWGKIEESFERIKKNKARHFRDRLFRSSGWQDSNLRPSGPKPDALTGLRYTPKVRLICLGNTDPGNFKRDGKSNSFFTRNK